MIEKTGGIPMSSFLNFSTYISENVETLAIQVVESVLGRLELEIPAWEKEQANNMYVELLRFFGDSFVEKEKEVAPDFFIDWSRKNAKMQVSSQGKISAIAVRYSPTRVVLTEILTKISQELDLSLEENALIIKRINIMLDSSLNETIFAYEQLYEEAKEETKKEMAALSAPIIPVKDGIVILPLIGDIDTYRVNFIMQHILPKIAEMDVKYLIIDFSGLYTVNIEIAEHLNQIGDMLKLIGIHVLTSGVRPDLAQVIVKSRINVAGLETFATVKKALETIS